MSKKLRARYRRLKWSAGVVGRMMLDSQEITRAVHDALETVEAPPAVSLAGRVLVLHEVLEAQRRADAATADQRLQDMDDQLVRAQREAGWFRRDRDEWKLTAEHHAAELAEFKRDHQGGGCGISAGTVSPHTDIEKRLITSHNFTPYADLPLLTRPIRDDPQA